MVLCDELKALCGRLLEATATGPNYRLYALNSTPPKPDMLRVDAGTESSIELEVWALPTATFGRFVAAIPPLLPIVTLLSRHGMTLFIGCYLG